MYILLFYYLLFILFLFYYRKKDFKITDGIQRVYGCNDRLLRSVETERSTERPWTIASIVCLNTAQRLNV